MQQAARRCSTWGVRRRGAAACRCDGDQGWACSRCARVSMSMFTFHTQLFIFTMHTVVYHGCLRSHWDRRTVSHSTMHSHLFKRCQATHTCQCGGLALPCRLAPVRCGAPHTSTKPLLPVSHSSRDRDRGAQQHRCSRCCGLHSRALRDRCLGMHLWLLWESGGLMGILRCGLKKVCKLESCAQLVCEVVPGWHASNNECRGRQLIII